MSVPVGKKWNPDGSNKIMSISNVKMMTKVLVQFHKDFPKHLIKYKYQKNIDKTRKKSYYYNPNFH